MRILLNITLTLLVVLSLNYCTSSSPPEYVSLETNNYNLGFENLYNENSVAFNWSFRSAKDVKIDSTIFYSGKYCVHFLNADTNIVTGLVYHNEIIIPEYIDSITVSCKIKKIAEGIDSLYLIIAHTDPSSYKTATVKYDSLLFESSEDWKDFSISIGNETKCNPFFFALQSSGSSDFYVDDFKVRFDGQALAEVKYISKNEIELLQKNLIPFQNPPLKEPVGDLSFLSTYTKNKKVIGLGEGNHGTREIFQIKSRMVKYLATNEGFNTVVFEDNMDNLNRINDYVTDANDTRPVDSLMLKSKHLFQVEELRDLIVWIKNYNIGKDIEDKIFFMGCDMQSDEGSLEYLKEYAEQHDEELLQLVLDSEKEYKVYEDFDIIKLIQDHLKHSTSKSEIDSITYHRLVQSADLIEQFLIFDSNLGNRSVHRDSCMANNLLWILDQYPNRKAFFWADNHHVKKKEGAVSGGFLEKALGDEYFVIGTSLGGGYTKGRFKDNAILSPRLFPSRREYFLNAVQDSFYFLPLDDFYPKFIAQKKDSMNIDQSWEFDLFDAMIYIKKASASRKINFDKTLEN